MSTSHESRPSNRLIDETSPYLLQHAYNPVDWFPWGGEALEKAKAENKPILLSIGYSACHWCHVMERESFEDENIAAIMNEHFICVKVDREERPDLDEIYMQATLAMNQGHGGWPMTVFLTPTQNPIFAGTYFPPTDRWGRPGFATILQKIAEGWNKDQDDIVTQASRFTSRFRQSLQVASPMAVGQTEIGAAVKQFEADFDTRYGGFGKAPKFPPATALSFLLRQYSRTRHDPTLLMVRKTLDAMAAGGMYDQIGGGFARYSTDDRWLVPHFEKMLYDNALLSRTYVEAYQVTGDVNYRRVATEIFDYILREMTSPEGGFFSATDADSEGVEGKFFVWTPEQIQHLVSHEEDAKRFCAYYDITSGGNWEHTSIPHIPKPLDEVAQELGCSSEDLRNTLHRVRPLVYEARRKRVPPGLDDKILTAWNGMMIGSMAEAARVLGESRYLTGARHAADFILHTLTRPDGGLYRTYRSGKAHLAGYLEDYAYLTESLIELYEAGAGEQYLTRAVDLAEQVVQNFSDGEHGGFFTTAKDHEALIVRSREGPDGAIPSGNAVAASALARLSFHFGREDFRETATKAIRVYGEHISQYPRAFAKSLMVTDFLLHGPIELALVGVPGESNYEHIRQAVNDQFVPHHIIAYRNPLEDESRHPLLQGKGLVNGKAALYICRNFSCEAPLTDPKDITRALTEPPRETPSDSSSTPRTLTAKGSQGIATPEGTANYVRRLLANPLPSRPSGHGYTALGSTGLTVSRIGFGSYRITPDRDEHRQALLKALRDGCNLIDTSTNYGDGGSERLIGAVLTELFAHQEISREEIVVVSKIGYVQGQNLKHAEEREQAGNPFPEMVKYGEGIWHCLHPEFLQEQLTLSLDRLGLTTLDICLLHNPEYFLSDGKNRNLIEDPSSLKTLREEFYRRLRQAFAYFETEVANGRLQSYGISSNTCTATSDDPEATSLSHMLEAANAAAQEAGQPNHHFRVLQLPMNLFESGAWFTRNTGPNQTHTALELAQHEHIAILVNRPLNAIPKNRGGILRLADPTVLPVPTSFEAQQEQVRTLEEEYRKNIAPSLPYSGQGMHPKDYFSWAAELSQIRSNVQNVEHWNQIESQIIAPHVNQVMKVLDRHFTDDKGERWQQWRHRYVPELMTLLQIMRNEASEKNRQLVASLTQRLDPLLPESKRTESFSRKSLWILASTPGVTCVLNGIRTPSYVEDSLAILGWEPAPAVASVYQLLKDHAPG